MGKRRANGEGALFQRKTGRHKGKWVLRALIGYTPDGLPVQKDMIFKTQGEGLAKLKEIELQLAKGIDLAPAKAILGDYLTQWLDRVKSKWTPNTYQRYRCACLIHLKSDPIWRMKLSEIRSRHVNDMLARRVKAGAKPATLQNIRAVFSTAMQQAMADDLIGDNPVRKSESVKQPDKSVKFLNTEETKRFLEAASGSPVEDLVFVAVYTGMRLSELLGLTWDRVDFAKKTLMIDRQLQRQDKTFFLAPLKTTGGKGTIPVSDVVISRLKALKGGQLLKGNQEDATIKGLIFCSPTGQPMHRKTALSATNRIMKKAELPELGFHALRHTCASILINMGADPHRVQRQLRHTNVRMTLEVYGHLFEERLHENVALMDQALS